MEEAIEDYGEDYYQDYGIHLEGWRDGATMLHICAMEGSLEVMEYLLALPEVDVNAVDAFNETPVFFAAFWGWYEVGFRSSELRGLHNYDVIRSFQC